MTLITIRIDSWMYSVPVCVCVNLEISGFSEETYERHSRNPQVCNAICLKDDGIEESICHHR